MPSARTRRSTRVFVPKSVKSCAGGETVRVLRSGKRLIFEEVKTPGGDEDEWLRLFGPPDVKVAGFCEWKTENRWDDSALEGCNVSTRESCGCVEALSSENAGTRREKFGIVYTRKRRRQRDKMYGIHFVRKQRKNNECMRQIKERDTLQSRNRRLLCQWASLVIFVELSHTTLQRFKKVLVTFLMRMRDSRLGLAGVAPFFLLESVSRFLSRHGIHFATECSSENHLSCVHFSSLREAKPGAGICTVHGARGSIPYVEINISVLPSYFLGVHVDISVRSFSLPLPLENYLKGFLRIASGAIVVYQERHPHHVKGTSVSLQGSSGGGVLDTNLTAPDRRFQLIAEVHNGSSLLAGSTGGSTCWRCHDASDIDFSDVKDDGHKLSPERTNASTRKSMRYGSVVKGERKLVLTALKQNIDSVHCAVNILVVETDRCWRECGAEVMLESAGPKEWCIAVKIQGLTRYIHRAKEMKPRACNRFTHALMWSGEKGWKLEFCNRKDWLVFKELYRECCERNLRAASVKIIPVPGVREIVGYHAGSHTSFARPSTYISVEDDEIQRALMCESGYDMDSGDEQWIEQLNDRNGSAEASTITVDHFEMIIYLFEKAAYAHPEAVSDEGRATNVCRGLAGPEMAATIFGYWLSKRKQKKSPLVRVFQAPHPKRAQLLQQPVYRKRRSFKRQASHVGRVRHESSFDAMAVEDALKKVKEAEQAASRALGYAVEKRMSAQKLMKNADLLLYKSIMAVRIASAIQAVGAECTASLVLG